jgi:hypothetical protein
MEKVKKVFIMLAHDEIKNKTVWEQYLQNDKIGLIVYVYKSNSTVKFDAFTTNYLASDEVCFKKSQWGEKSLVEIEIALMREAFFKFSNAECFFTVSGRDIPIVSSEDLCLRTNETCLESGKANGFFVKEGGNLN